MEQEVKIRAFRNISLRSELKDTLKYKTVAVYIDLNALDTLSETPPSRKRSHRFADKTQHAMRLQ